MKFVKMTIMLGVLIASPVYPDTYTYGTIPIKNNDCMAALSTFPDSIEVRVTSSDLLLGCKLLYGSTNDPSFTKRKFTGATLDVKAVDSGVVSYVDPSGNLNDVPFTCPYKTEAAGTVSAQGWVTRAGDSVTCNAGFLGICQCSKY